MRYKYHSLHKFASFLPPGYRASSRSNPLLSATDSDSSEVPDVDDATAGDEDEAYLPATAESSEDSVIPMPPLHFSTVLPPGMTQQP